MLATLASRLGRDIIRVRISMRRVEACQIEP
jgi:hypothetical protein